MTDEKQTHDASDKNPNEFKILWAWCGRIAVGWSTHKRVEAFFEALKLHPDKYPGFEKLTHLPSPETENLVTAWLNKVAISGFIRFVVFVVPMFFLWLQIAAVNKQNDLILQQNEMSKKMELTKQDLDYIRILSDHETSPQLRGVSVAGLIEDDRVRIGYNRYNNVKNMFLNDVDVQPRTDLSLINFEGSKIRSATFKFVDMSFDWFRDVDMSNSIFESTQLHGALFYNANVQGASFHNACLAGADLSQTNIQEDQISGACGDKETKLPANFPPNFKLPQCRMLPAVLDRSKGIYSAIDCRK